MYALRDAGQSAGQIGWAGKRTLVLLGRGFITSSQAQHYEEGIRHITFKAQGTGLC